MKSQHNTQNKSLFVLRIVCCFKIYPLFFKFKHLYPQQEVDLFLAWNNNFAK